MRVKSSLAQIQSIQLSEKNLLVKVVEPVNLGPPYFVGGLPDLKVRAREQLDYKLPLIVDPDRDDIEILSVNMMAVSKFATYDTKNLTFRFKPEDIDVSKN